VVAKKNIKQSKLHCVSKHVTVLVEIFVGAVHREFSCESIGERFVKIGPRLPKLLSNIKGYSFLRHSV